MNKVYRIFLFFISFFSLSSIAQTDNYAVVFNGGESSINFKQIPELNNLSKYTVQFWMNPSVWVSNASIYTRGAFDVRLGTEAGKIIFKIGSQSVDIESPDLAVGKWAQVTFIVDEKKTSTYVNGASIGIQNAVSPLVIPTDDSEFIVGKEFVGRIDEFRMWTTALDETEYLTHDSSVKGYLLWDNTLNKFHPDYASLLLYCKFDQNLCENIVDYTFHHHGTMQGGVTREIVTDNELFKYRIVTAYTEYSRFTDSGADRNKYLLCNDLLALAASLNNDGSASVHLPFDQGVLTGGATYLGEYEGRTGVLALDGTGKMNVGTTAMDAGGGYCFCSWFYIDEWVENAFLFKKERDENTGISLRLGKEEEQEVVFRLNGDEYRYRCKGELVEGKWIHLGVTTFDNKTLGKTFLFACNKKKSNSFPYSYPETVKPWTLPDLKDVVASVGENFKGKMDETMIWNAGRGRESIYDYADNGANMPGIAKNVGTDYAYYAGCYWTYDKPEDPGYDFFSYREYLRIMRSAYANYRGYKVRLSVSGGSDWMGTIANEAKRERFTTEMAAIINGDDELDGIDFDLEWPGYSGQNANWTNYGKLITLLRSKLNPGKILTISPHTVSYWFPKEDMQSVDYFLFQNYGPDRNLFTYENYVSSYKAFLAWGYPAEKIVMSFSSTTSNHYTGNTRDGEPVRIHQVGNIGPDDNESNGYSFTGFNQTRWRSEQVKQQGLGGIMCWSLNRDYSDTGNPLSLFRASAFALSSNVDTLITKVNMDPVGVVAVKSDKSLFSIYPNPSEGEANVIIPQGEIAEQLSLYSNSGKLMQTKRVSGYEGSYKYEYGVMEPGFYILKLKTKSGKQYSETMIIK
ncbi:LamG-like jellyroll fold domain-containing protein [Bacteroides sp.]